MYVTLSVGIFLSLTWKYFPQKVKNWYNNHKTGEKDGRAENEGPDVFHSLGIGRKWNRRTVIMKECKAEIEALLRDDSGAPLVGAAFIKTYQKAVSTYIASLSRSKVREYERRAAEWNARGPEPEERRK
jgi:hypothetical protein